MISSKLTPFAVLEWSIDDALKPNTITTTCKSELRTWRDVASDPHQVLRPEEGGLTAIVWREGGCFRCDVQTRYRSEKDCS
jgi:hypothetical protein